MSHDKLCHLRIVILLRNKYHMSDRVQILTNNIINLIMSLFTSHSYCSPNTNFER